MTTGKIETVAFSCETADVGLFLSSTRGRESNVEEMALTACFEDEMEETKVLSISYVECLGQEYSIGWREGYTAYIHQKGDHATGFSTDNRNCISSAELDIKCHVQLELI